MKPETAAFGYLREACIQSSGSLATTFGYPRHAPCLLVPASDGLMLLKAWRGLSFL
jgi:hypothetical protein